MRNEPASRAARVVARPVTLFDLESLDVFTRLIDRGSFTAVALDLNSTPSTISKKITRLEKDVGAKLVNRSTHTLALTEAGAVLYERAARLLYDARTAAEAVGHARDNVGGVLKIHVTPGLGQDLIMPLLFDFMKLHPEITVKLTVRPEPMNVLHSDLDLSIRSGAADDPSLDQTSTACRELCKAHYQILAATDYLNREGRPSHPTELARHRCLIHMNQPFPHDWWFQEDNSRYSVKVSGPLLVDNWAVIRTAMEEGVGIARTLALDGVQTDLPGIEPMFTGFMEHNRRIWAFYPRSKNVPQKLTALLTYLEHHLNARTSRRVRQLALRQ